MLPTLLSGDASTSRLSPTPLVLTDVCRNLSASQLSYRSVVLQRCPSSATRPNQVEADQALRPACPDARGDQGVFAALHVLPAPYHAGESREVLGKPYFHSTPETERLMRSRI